MYRVGTRKRDEAATIDVKCLDLTPQITPRDSPTDSTFIILPLHTQEYNSDHPDTVLIPG